MDPTKRYCKYNKIKTKIKKNQKKKELEEEKKADPSEAKYKLDRFIADVKRYAEKVKKNNRRRQEQSTNIFLDKKGIFENAIIGKPQMRGESFAMREQKRLNAARLKGDLNSMVKVSLNPLSFNRDSTVPAGNLSVSDEDCPSIVENPININKLLTTPSSPEEENEDPTCATEERLVPFSPLKLDMISKMEKTCDWLLLFNKTVECSGKTECFNSKIQVSRNFLEEVGRYVLDTSKKIIGNHHYASKKNILSKIELIATGNSCMRGTKDDLPCQTCCLENLWEKPNQIQPKPLDLTKQTKRSPKVIQDNSGVNEASNCDFGKLNFLSQEPNTIDLTEDLPSPKENNFWDLKEKRIEDPTPQINLNHSFLIPPPEKRIEDPTPQINLNHSFLILSPEKRIEDPTPQINLNHSFLIPSPKQCRKTPISSNLHSELSFLDSIDVRLKEFSSNIESKLQDVLNDNLEDLPTSMNSFLSPIPKLHNYVDSPILVPDIPKKNKCFFNQGIDSLKKLEAFDTPHNETFHEAFNFDMPSTSQTVNENNYQAVYPESFSYTNKRVIDNTNKRYSRFFQKPQFVDQRIPKRKDSNFGKYPKTRLNSKYDLKNTFKPVNNSLNLSMHNNLNPFLRKHKSLKRRSGLDSDIFNQSHSSNLHNISLGHTSLKRDQCKFSMSQSFSCIPSPPNNPCYPLSPIVSSPLVMDSFNSQKLLAPDQLEFRKNHSRNYNLWRNKKLFSPHNF